jgi:hypothetical protein
MSGSNSSVPDSRPEPAEGLSLTVHTLPNLAPERRRLSGRLQMLMVLAVCAAPVIASYFTYYVVRPGGRTNYGELIDPQRSLPSLPLQSLTGEPVPASSLKGQWLLVAVAGGACDAACEKTLYLQRQLRETLGREKDRVDKVWLIPDGAAPRPRCSRRSTRRAPKPRCCAYRPRHWPTGSSRRQAMPWRITSMSSIPWATG